MTTIMAINESENLLMLMRDRLVEIGYTVYLRHPSDDTRDLIRSLQPDIVILDVVDSKALQLFQQMQHDPAVATIPMIVMLAPWQKEDFTTQLLRMQQVMLLKPFALDNLLDAISSLLSPDSRR